jgi:RimJ/RimL family protein N-acetyltransferase
MPHDAPVVAEASQYSVFETARDGRRIEIRALQPADREALASTFARMSDESVRRRFFIPKRYFSDREIDFYVNVDFVSQVALVAVADDGGRALIIGGARYVVCGPGVAELAFAIDDAHQGRGVGTLLMRHLVLLARRAGLRELTAEVLASNAAMLRVFTKAELTMTTQHSGDVVHVTLRLP